VTEPVTEPQTEPQTTPPETEPQPAKSGCGAVISGGAVIAILCLGAAVVAKRKEN
jgi:uncharacterized protein HemX